MIENLCLFSHFDRDNIIDPHVVHYISALHAAGFTVVVISTSKLGQDEIEKLKPYCIDIMQKENVGLDHGSWQYGWNRYKDRFSGNLLLANDSVYGPIGSLTDALERLTRTPADLYGLATSLLPAPHIQSWFRIFTPALYQHEIFTHFMSLSFSTMIKEEIIAKGEIGLSLDVAAAGFASHDLFVGENSYVQDLIPTHSATFLWRELVDVFGIPFIKVERLRDDFFCDPHQERDWRALVRKYEPILELKMNNHLVRMQTGGTYTKKSLKQRLIHVQYFILSPVPFVRRDFQFTVHGKMTLRKLNRLAFELYFVPFNSLKNRIKSVVIRVKKMVNI